MGEVCEGNRGTQCREGMQRNKNKKQAGGGSLGAALVACLSMEHITTGFDSQRWKNHVPKAVVVVVVGAGGFGLGEGGRIALEMAWMWCGVGMVDFGDGGDGGGLSLGPESLGPE